MRRYSKEGLIAAGLLSAAAFALGDLWAAALRSLEGPWLQNVGAAMEAVPSILTTQGISAEPNALLGGIHLLPRGVACMGLPGAIAGQPPNRRGARLRALGHQGGGPEVRGHRRIPSTTSSSPRATGSQSTPASAGARGWRSAPETSSSSGAPAPARPGGTPYPTSCR